MNWPWSDGKDERAFKREFAEAREIFATLAAAVREGGQM